MTNSDLQNFYVGLLAIQYKTRPNAVATIQALAAQVVAGQIYTQVQNAFDLNTAVGAQLDTLAGYVGAPRTIFGYNPALPYFALTSYSQVPASNVGFADYSDVSDPVDYFLNYNTGETSYTLTDGQLRLLIAYLIAVHMSDHTLKSIDLILETFFGQYCTLIDNENMSVTYAHLLSDPNFLFSIVNQIGALPHPAGVSVIVTES